MQTSELHWTRMIKFKEILEVKMKGELESINNAIQIVQGMKNIHSSKQYTGEF